MAVSFNLSGTILGSPSTITVKWSGGTGSGNIHVTWSCGTESGTIGNFSAVLTSGTRSFSYTFPISLASQNVTGTTVPVRISVISAVGGSSGTYSFAIPATVKPSVYWKTVEDATGHKETFGGYIQGVSKLNVAISVDLAYGSAIQSKTITFDGRTYTNAEFETPTIQNSGTLPLTASVTDGRGRTGTNTVELTVLPYSSPAITKLTVHRCNADGTENITGSYAKATYSFEICSLSSQNAKNIVLKYKKKTDSSYTSVTLTSAYSVTDGTYIFAADDGSSYDVLLSVADTFKETTKAIPVSTANVQIHMNDDGTGIAFGKICERSNAVEFGREMYDKFGALIGNGLAAYTGGGDSGIDPDTTLEGLCLTSHSNGPKGLGTFYYILTVFYNTKSVTAARAQFAFPYKMNGSAYHRYFADGAWSSWQSQALEAYPVGSYYIANNTTSPASIFGGTWQRVEGRFLYGCASSGTVGATGSYTAGSGSSTLPYVNVALWHRTA